MEERLITHANTYDNIRREAKEAAARGETLEATCRWPWSSAEGRLFADVFIMHKAALAALGMNDKPLTTD